MTIKSLTIYCSSSNNLDSNYYNLTMGIAKLLQKYSLSMIYGGGKIGIMGKMAKNCMDLNINVTGIIPKFLNTKEIMFNEINELIVVENMIERKKLLFENGDAFLILPGGTGTLEEVIEVLSWKALNLHSKPIIFYNYNNFWSNLILQLDFFIKEKFSNKNLQNMYQIVEDLNHLEYIFKSWQK